jgi:hypothetical protein
VVGKITLNWCYDGKVVSDWSGECDGWATKWGKAIFWDFDGCVQNDWLPYSLGGRTPGGIHHKTKLKFVNKTPWTYDTFLRLEMWGHCRGTWDMMIDGKLTGTGKSTFKGCDKK